MNSGSLYLLPSAGLLLVFLANVVAGASGLGAFLSDVAEMLTLFTACIGFVVATLAYERAARSQSSKSHKH